MLIDIFMVSEDENEPPDGGCINQRKRPDRAEKLALKKYRMRQS